MNSLADLIETLDAAPDRVPAMAADLLLATFDWPGLIADALASASPEEFHHLATVLNVKDVQPWNILLHAGAGYKIVLNHFSSAVFAECIRGRTISPHRHHFDFTTRLVTGRYSQWIYDNRGTVDQPDLRILGQVCTDRHDVYAFDARDYHFVAAVDDDTVSLQIRYAEEEGVQWRGDPRLTRMNTDELHRRLLAVLTPAPAVPGRMIELSAPAPARRMPASGQV